MGKTTLEVKDLPKPVFKDTSVLNFLQKFKDYNDLSKEQQEWFYWTNYSRTNPKRYWDSVVAPLLVVFPNLDNDASRELKDDLYETKQLSLIKPNDKLKTTATKHALALAQSNSNPSHTSPNGDTFKKRMDNINIQNCAGENISYGDNNPLLMVALLFIDEGVPQRGHRKALLNPLFTEMGIGIGKYHGNIVIVVQDFACEQKN